MTKQRMRRWATCLVILLLSLGLTGYSFGDGPSKAVITQAVTQQAERNQMALWQQLSPQAETAPVLSVSNIKVRRTRPVQVASTLAVEATGTYRYKIHYSHGQPVERAQAPFSVVLQTIPETNHWQLLRIEVSRAGDRTWSWQPLQGDRA